MRKSTLLGAFVSLALINLAHADPQGAGNSTAGGAPNKTVSFAGLDWKQPEATSLAYGRIERAAREVCGAWAGPKPLAQIQAQGACVSSAIATAVEKVNVPALTAYAATKIRKSAKAVAVAAR